MALRSTSQANSSGGNDIVVIPAPAGATSGDLILLFIYSGGSATNTLSSVPGGCTLLTTANNTGAGRGNSCTMFCYWTTTISGSYSFTVAGGNLDSPFGCAGAWTGRVGAAPTAFQPSSNVNGSASPVTIGLTQVTAAAGDDLCAVPVVNSETAASWAWTQATGFTGQQTVHLTSAGNQGASMFLETKDNVSAGATGTISSVATLAANNSDGLGILVSIPSSGGGVSPPLIYTKRTTITLDTTIYY